MTGTIRFDSSEIAEVYINNKYIGETPIDVTDVFPLVYTYLLIKNKNGENSEITGKVSVYNNKITHIKVGKNKIEWIRYIDIIEKTNKDKESSTDKTQSNQIVENKKPDLSRVGVYDITTTITSSVPSDPKDPVSNVYQLERINDILGHNAEILYVYNSGAGLLYMVISVDGIHFTQETLIYEGEQKKFTNIHTIGLRSPTAGLIYRVTEREIISVSSQIFTGSRFKDRRNRQGVTLFHDDYESPTRKFKTDSPPNIGAGTITRDISSAYFGDFSIKSTTGNNFGDTNVMEYFFTDFHRGKIGAQIRFASNVPDYSVGIQIRYNNSFTSVLQGEVKIDKNGVLSMINDTTTVLSNNIPVISSKLVYNTIKLSINISTGFYGSVNVNGIEIDLSNIELRKLTPNINSSIFVHADIIAKCENVAGCSANTVFFDDFIFTEDES